MKDLDNNTIELAIADITHNIECIREAKESNKQIDKKDYSKEINRLRGLLNKYKEIQKELAVK